MEVTKIGYLNHKDHAITIALGAGGHEIGAKQPVVGQDGKLIKNSTHLDQLVELGLLRHIASNDPEYAEWDKRVEQRSKIRLSSNLKKPPKADPKPESLVTVVSSDKGLTESALPDGAKWINQGNKRMLEYKGKRFSSIKALNAYLAESGEE